MPTAGLIALYNLPQHRVPPGDRVLVNGAAGGVGAIAVQLAKAYGAHVTGVDHPRKLALVTLSGRGPGHRLHRARTTPASASAGT